MIWLRSNPSLSVKTVSADLSFDVSSKAVSIRCIRAALFHGFVIKSKAPACIPCTANGILPHAVINITGTSGQNSLTCLSSISPSSPLVERLKFISIRISCGVTERTVSIASLGPETVRTSYFARFSMKLSEERIALSSSIISIITLQK